MTLQNGYKLETSKHDLSDYNPVIDYPLDIRNRDLYLSDRPGLGINFDREYVRAHAMESFERPNPLNS